MRPKILYLTHANGGLYGLIRAELPATLELVTLSTDEEPERLAALATADAVIVQQTKLTRSRINAATRLRFVHHQGVGYQDTIDLAALAERAVPLAITPGGTAGVAEHTVLLILAALKRLPFADAELRRGRFHTNALRPHTRDLQGKTVGLLGLGRIGKMVAERLRPFEVELVYHDPAAAISADEVARLGLQWVGFEQLLAASDILSLHLPLLPTTHRIIGAAALRTMKRDAILVNTSRGGLIDEDALYDSLCAMHLSGAALDVFDPEPPAASHRLFRLPNVVLTPHVAGGTGDTFSAKMRAIFRNLDAYFAGRPVENLIEYGPATQLRTAS